MIKVERIKKRLRNLALDLNGIADMLYQQKYQQAYEKIDGVLIELSDVLDTIYGSSEQANIHVENLMKILTNAIHAMEKKDSVLVADILKYDVIEELQKIDL